MALYVDLASALYIEGGRLIHIKNCIFRNHADKDFYIADNFIHELSPSFPEGYFSRAQASLIKIYHANNQYLSNNEIYDTLVLIENCTFINNTNT